MHEPSPDRAEHAPAGLTFSAEDPTREPAAALLAAMSAELVEINRGPAGRPLSPEELSPPTGTYVVVRLDGDPVAGGGLRRLTEGVGEIKRMYVRPDVRGRGIAAALLGALEASALEMGYRVVRLDTGPRQPHAQRLYERSGYRSVPDYNGNRLASFWGEKELEVPPGRPG